jgi:hypothetical protein
VLQQIPFIFSFFQQLLGQTNNSHQLSPKKGELHSPDIVLGLECDYWETAKATPPITMKEILGHHRWLLGNCWRCSYIACTSQVHMKFHLITVSPSNRPFTVHMTAPWLYLWIVASVLLTQLHYRSCSHCKHLKSLL